jgi:AraC-like DNA-binding protein
MQQAAAQLQTSNDTIKQVADTLGFSDPFHFSRVFKSVLGVSPSRFAQLGRRAASLPTGKRNGPE